MPLKEILAVIPDDPAWESVRALVSHPNFARLSPSRRFLFLMLAVPDPPLSPIPESSTQYHHVRGDVA